MKKIDFTKLPIGTDVWSIKHGWGKISKISTCSTKYPVFAFFNGCERTYTGCERTYTADGKYQKDDFAPTLFLNEFEIPEEAYISPRPNLKVDDRVIVWNNSNEKHNRYFKCWDKDGRIVCFESGRTSWSSYLKGESWGNYELPVKT